MKKETQRSLILQKQRPSERPATSKDGGLLPLVYLIRGEMESKIIPIVLPLLSQFPEMFCSAMLPSLDR